MNQLIEDKKTVCYHCGDWCLDQSIQSNDHSFCCVGCKTVFELLHEGGLCDYYQLNNYPGVSQRQHIRSDKFAFLDDESIQNKLIQFRQSEKSRVTFYIPQIHCSSCLWLIENVYRINSGIIQSTVHFPKKEVTIVFDTKNTSLRKVVETLSSIGYEPYLSLEDTDKKRVTKTDRSQLLKLGVAGFCFANIMMLSFPDYFALDGSIDKNFSYLFRYINLALSIPVFFYSATEFFYSAWKAIQHRYVSIDFPIAIAISVTFIRSIVEIVSGSGTGYLDSMSGIVFLMLVGRVWQGRTYRALSFDRDYTSYFPISVTKRVDGNSIPIALPNIKVGDVLLIYSQELIPADGILSKGKAVIDYSFVTGESVPVAVSIGEIVYAGGRQVGESIELVVVKEVAQSYLTSLWSRTIFKKQKTEKRSFIHWLSQYFTWVVLAIATSAFTYWSVYDPVNKWNAFTGVLIVACPCALLLSATFTNGNLISIFSKRGFFVKHAEVIEQLSKCNHIVWDKTGTLTESNQFEVTFSGEKLAHDQLLKIGSLALQSTHPLSKAIVYYINSTSFFSVENYKETVGCGIEAWIDDSHYQLGSSSFVGANSCDVDDASHVWVSIDGVIKGKFSIRIQVRKKLKDIFKILYQSYRLSILSGDHPESKSQIKELIDGMDVDTFFDQKPEDKLEYIRSLQLSGGTVCMIGDGLNDAGAFQQSDVAIAITHHHAHFSPACDAMLKSSSMSDLASFFRLAKWGKYIILSSFVFSIVYNIVGLFYAITAQLSPLVAAILMPISSITIFLYTFGAIFFLEKRLFVKTDKNHISN